MTYFVSSGTQNRKPNSRFSPGLTKSSKRISANNFITFLPFLSAK